MRNRLYRLLVGPRKLGQRLAWRFVQRSDSKVRCIWEPRPCPVRFASKRIAMSSSALVCRTNVLIDWRFANGRYRLRSRSHACEYYCDPKNLPPL
jgi:hypothetical protein